LWDEVEVEGVIDLSVEGKILAENRGIELVLIRSWSQR
jgi:hypothetical protein